MGHIGFTAPAAAATTMRDLFARPTQFGFVAPTNSGAGVAGIGPGGSGGAVSASGSAAVQSDAAGMAVRLTTGAVSGNVALAESNSSASLAPVNLYDLIFKFRANTAATVRYFFGVTGNTSVTELGADTPAASHRIGLTFSTSRPDTNWQFVRGANAWTLDDTGVAFAAGVYYFRITWVTTSDVFCKLYNSAGTLLVSREYTSGLPTNSGRVLAGVTTLTAGAANFDHYLMQWTMPSPVTLTG